VHTLQTYSTRTCPLNVHHLNTSACAGPHDEEYELWWMKLGWVVDGATGAQRPSEAAKVRRARKAGCTRVGSWERKVV